MKFATACRYTFYLCFVPVMFGCSNELEQTLAVEKDSTTESVLSAEPLFGTTAPGDDQSGPGERYVIHDNGTVTDVTTGLTWMSCSMGQEWDGTTCIGEAETYRWRDIEEAAVDVVFAGESDWRVPTVAELESLVYCSSGEKMGRVDGRLRGCAGDYQQPTIVHEPFPATPGEWFWTSTTSAQDLEYAWSAHFGAGYVLDNDKINRYHLRLVRD